MKKEQLTLNQKWNLDLEFYKKSGGMPVIVPQCRNCQFWVKTDALHCVKFQKTNKPSYVFSAVKECPKYTCSEELFVDTQCKTESKIKGALWGAIIGDALGVPLEFSDRLSRRKDPVKEMRAYGTYNQPFGTWSDDSSMMLCLVETINEGFSLDLLADKFVNFASNAYLTPHNEVFDIGNAVRKAITNIKAGVESTKCGGTSEYDNGNGSLMRILPLAFFLKSKQDEEIIEIVENVSSITHRHPISVFACVFYVKMAIELLNGKEKKEAYLSSIDFSKKIVDDRFTNIYPIYERVLNAKIQKCREETIKSSGYVVDTLEAALWCFLNTKSYNECVFKAINLGGDTDTIACIAGGLAGLYYGIENINNNWIQLMAKKEQLNEMINRFYKVVAE